MPATCLLVVTISLNLWMARSGKSSYLTVVPAGSNMLASLSLYYHPETSDKENVWSAATFDWTKGGRSLSTTGSFPLWKTNIQKL
jgi:hypothetical protein